MKLGRSRPRHAQIPATPLANLALLILTIVMIAGMLSASRGPALRFAGSVGGGGFDDRGAVRVEVLPDEGIRVDGAPVTPDRLREAVSVRLGGRPDGAVILAVAPEASYQAMIAAYAAIAAMPGPPRIALAPRTWRAGG